MAGKSIETLSQDPDGFFLMAEVGIDEMAHQSDPELVIEAGRSVLDSWIITRVGGVGI